MVRTMLVFATIVTGTAAVFAQSDRIAARKASESRAAAQTLVGAEMARGEVPFDLAKAQAIFDTYFAAASALNHLLPDSAQTGTNMSDYDKAVARYADDAKQAKAQVSDLDSFKMLFPKVVRNCAACHESYRAKSR